MRRWTLAAALLVAAIPPASARPQQPAAPPPAKDAAAAPRPPLAPEEAARLVRRAEANLRLHGLSLEARYLARALFDLRAVAARLPAAADEDLRFRAWFDLGFALARTDLERVPGGTADPIAEAGAALAEAEKIHPSFPGIPIAVGMIRKQRGEAVEAMDLLTTGLDALESWQGLADDEVREMRLLALLSRAQATLVTGQAKEHLALRDVQAAAALADVALQDPRTPPGNGLRRVVLTHLAAVYQRLDQFENAAKVLLWMMEDDPGNATHSYHLALIQANLQRFPDAMDSYRRAARLDPADPRPHLKIAYILLQFGNREGKIDLEEAARAGEVYHSLRRGAMDGEYCALRAQIAELRRDPKSAEQWARRALEQDPLCRTALNILIKALGSGDPDATDVRQQIDSLRRRLQESLQRNAGGSDRTFC
jgi:tetratricopeptide (TPR) repeat protein